MHDERYRPFDIAELEDKVSLLNEPIREVIELRPGQSAASLYAALAGALSQVRGLVERLETKGVVVRRDNQREVIRETYVASRRLVRALEATLRLEGLE
jgi:hypothetical protein